jgi:hypothetical protein
MCVWTDEWLDGLIDHFTLPVCNDRSRTRYLDRIHYWNKCSRFSHCPMTSPPVRVFCRLSDTTKLIICVLALQ